MGNQLGFITPAIVGLPVQTCVMIDGKWDRQTVVIYCDEHRLDSIRHHIHKVHRPHATSNIPHGIIDVFVNLNYSPSERDPANRNIRIVYCSKELSVEEIINRFPNCYILLENEKGDNVGWNTQNLPMPI